MPKFEREKWNDGDKGGKVKNANNCYDYAVDKLSGKDYDSPEFRKSRPGRKAGKPLKRPPFSCKDIQAAIEADRFRPSTKDAQCPDTCWKVAVMILGDKDKGEDYHFVRRDDEGSWSHKQGEGPAKQTDSKGDPITDPDLADIRYKDPDTKVETKYLVCGYYCCCPEVTVATLAPERPPVFAAVELKERGRLTTRSLDLHLPPGRYTILSGEVPMPSDAVLVTAVVFSGEDNPRWALAPADLEVVTGKIAGLPRTDRRPQFLTGYQGFIISNAAGIGGLPAQITACDGLVSLWSGAGSVEWFEDASGLEPWLLCRLAEQPDAERLRRVSAPSAGP
ncbi:MAG TPA: hypothetical protein VLI67_11670 [Vicinamibacteria bacterium]|nr:hypothetical protein [Vicinamibacteria bacterium]